MNSETIAILTLAAYAAMAVVGVILYFRSIPLSFGASVLTICVRIYAALMFHRRTNRRCPFPEGPAIILANHRSPVDPILLWMHSHLTPYGSRKLNLIDFMMAGEYADIPFVGALTRSLRAIPVERSGRDLAPTREALRRLEAGHWLGIFPEGCINRGTDLLEADSGIAWLALRAKVPVYPVFIHNAPQGRNMLEPFFTLCRVRVVYGDPIDLSEYYGKRKSQVVLREVTELMMTRLAELGGVRYGGPNAIPFDEAMAVSA